jgi:adenylate cyclase
MGTEIERKFKVSGDGWRDAVQHSCHIQQGYLAVTDALIVRIRIVDAAVAKIGIKSAGYDERIRGEFEYDVPIADARQLMQLAGDRVLEKRRHNVESGGKDWVIDTFEGRLNGLVLAEIELDDRDETFDPPVWLGEEVTGNPQFSNSELAARRF